MKIRLHFKTNDVAYYALAEITDENQKIEAENAIEKFVKYGENLIVEIDTETKKAIVVPV